MNNDERLKHKEIKKSTGFAVKSKNWVGLGNGIKGGYIQYCMMGSGFPMKATQKPENYLVQMALVTKTYGLSGLTFVQNHHCNSTALLTTHSVIV